MAFRLRRGLTVPHLALAILVWSGLLVVPLGQHLMVHGSGPMDTSRHSSPFCAWMCSAASAVHSADTVPERILILTGFQPAVVFESVFEKPFEDSPNIRPPPYMLS